MPVHEWARDPDERYAVYRVSGSTPLLLATTSKEGIGTALVQLREDGDIRDSDPIGVLDGITGRWVVNPFAAGRHDRGESGGPRGRRRR